EETPLPYKIQQATAKRLPLYYRFINNLHNQGKARVFWRVLSDVVGVVCAGISGCITYSGALGKNGYGYKVEYLLEFCKKTLAQDQSTNNALITSSTCGSALLNSNILRNKNTRIAKAFDRSTSKTGKLNGEVPVYHIDELEENLEDIQVAILTVPAAVAQDIANRLVDKGIKGILNFTPARLTLPEDVRIHHIDLSVELQSFVYFLKHYPM